MNRIAIVITALSIGALFAADNPIPQCDPCQWTYPNKYKGMEFVVPSGTMFNEICECHPTDEDIAKFKEILDRGPLSPPAETHINLEAGKRHWYRAFHRSKARIVAHGPLLPPDPWQDGVVGLLISPQSPTGQPLNHTRP